MQADFDTVRLLQGMVDAVPGIMVYWDRAGLCRYANRAALAWFGRSADEVLGRSAAELLDGAYAATVNGLLTAALAGQGTTLERENSRPHGSDFYQVHYVPALGEQSQVMGVYVMAFDITALKRAENELRLANEALLRARDEADAASRAKSAFVANMSHEIRTPMNAIVGLTHLMARSTEDGVQRDRLGKIDDAAKHLLQVINDILDLSKIEAGKVALESVDFS
ncbi:MAG: hybrid sensor histidine kinase/response regulator, partial [Comamonadaceae bacterium PBBC2]